MLLLIFGWCYCHNYDRCYCHILGRCYCLICVVSWQMLLPYIVRQMLLPSFLWKMLKPHKFWTFCNKCDVWCYCLVADGMATAGWLYHFGRCYCHGSWSYFNFSSEVLSRTSSQMWGRWYLPIFLLRDGLLTLIYKTLQENHFLQTWGSSQQWAKAWLSSKLFILVLRKLLEIHVTLTLDMSEYTSFLPFHQGESSIAAQMRPGIYRSTV